MKAKLTFYVALAATILSLNAYAQPGKGTINLGVGTSGGFTSIDGNSSFNVAVDGNYFITDNLGLGAILGYEDNGNFDATSYGVQAKYFFNESIFAATGYAATKFDTFTIGYIPLNVGYAIWLNDNVAFEPTAGYMLAVGDNKDNAIALNIALSVYLKK